MDEEPGAGGARVSAAWRLALAGLRRLPQGALSRGFGRLADAPIPRRLRRPLLGAFARAVGVEVSEVARPLEAYGSLNAFFVRRLREGVRCWPADPRVVASPVDGTVGAVGVVRSGRLLQAKGRWYSAAELLDDDAAERFEGGAFATLYLGPRDYHRIHAPAGGVIPRARYVPGALLPVNPAAVVSVADLFVRNERLICYIDGRYGLLAVIAIGAYNVGRISAAFDAAWSAPAGAPGWVTNRRGAVATTRDYAPALPIERGDDLMAFHLGSTVVVLLERGMERVDAVREGASIRLGDALARPTSAT